MSEEKDPGIKGKKLSKSNVDWRDTEQSRMLSKYYDRQIAWLKDPTYDNLIAYRNIGNEYKRLYDK